MGIKMRIPKRGLVLAAGVAALPLSAQAECPPEASIDRYAQTAGDALSALNGLVPASQQLALEDRYAAMLVLKWNWQGAEGLIFNEAATGFLKSCIESGRCEATSGDDLEIDADGVPNAPSNILKSWAERVLECPSSVVVAAPIDVTAPETEPEREPDVAPVEQMGSAEPETTPEVQAVPPPSPSKRARKRRTNNNKPSSQGNRGASRSRSPSERRRRAASRSRSRSPSQRKIREGAPTKKPARSREGSPNKKQSTKNKRPSADGASKRPSGSSTGSAPKRPSGSSTGPKRRSGAASQQPQKAKSKRQ